MSRCRSFRKHCAGADDEVRAFGGGEGFVAGNDEEVVVVFVGSRNLTHWVSNLRVEPVPSHGGNVHRGFTVDLNVLHDEATRHLHGLRSDRHKLYITGHSRGGALAMLFARRLQEDGLPGEKAVFTFGALRIGDQDFAATFDLDLVRIENVLDPVPHLPRGAFIHIGRQVWLTAGGLYVPDGSDADTVVKTAEAIKEGASLLVRLFRRQPARFLSYHLIATYIECLRSIALA